MMPDAVYYILLCHVVVLFFRFSGNCTCLIISHIVRIQYFTSHSNVSQYLKLTHDISQYLTLSHSRLTSLLCRRSPNLNVTCVQKLSPLPTSISTTWNSTTCLLRGTTSADAASSPSHWSMICRIISLWNIPERFTNVCSAPTCSTQRLI